MTHQQLQAENTKERILETAEKLFADKGYNGVSVRDITRSAACNVAAVNYHFGNKENLYFDVFRQRILPKMTHLRLQIEDYLTHYDDITLEVMIRALVTIFIDNNVRDAKDDVINRLVGSDGQRPIKAKEIIVKEALIPFYKDLMALFKPYFPAEMDEMKIKMNILSIISMVVYFSHSQMSVAGFTGRAYDEAFINELIEHTVTFTLNGLNGV